MADRISGHVRVLLGDALEEAASGDWERARPLAEAVLALQPDNADARSIVQQANAARSPGERRQLTVVFSDVVGSTALAAVADPEVILDVLGTYHSACARVVNKHDGYIAQFLGDGVLAYFGYPRAHEDDARLAVQAGLEILVAVEEVAQTIRARYDLDFAVRVAVHTGLVVRAELTAAQYRNRDAIAGQTPNLAARLQDLARPGTLVISGATYQLVEGFFVCEPLGRLALRGIDDGVDAYQVTGRTLAETRLEAATQSAPFVGRDLEMGRLAAMWRKVQDRGSASLLIRGEPGVGKSRLALTFRNLVESDGGGAVSSACSTYQSETPLYPIVRLLMTVLGVDLRDDAGAAVEPLRTSLAAVGREDMLGAFADLLRLPRQEGWSSPEVDPQQLRQAVLDTLLQWVVVEAGRAPTLIVIDDLQWADASTLELIDRVVRASDPRVLACDDGKG